MISLWLAALVSVGGAWQSTDSVPVLDLTRPIPTEVRSSPQLNQNCGPMRMEFASVTGTPRPKMPLKVTLLSLDKRQYKRGEYVTFEVSVQNVGTEPFLIPWGSTAELPKIQPAPCVDPPGFRIFNMTLENPDKTVSLELLAGEPIYGSEFVPETLKWLDPGEVVRIRAKAAVMLYRNLPEALAALPAKVRLRAYLAASTTGFTPMTVPDPVVSSDTIEVTLIR